MSTSSEAASFEIRADARTYGVKVARGTVADYLAARPDTVVIADAIFVADLERSGRRVLGMEAVETNKTLDRAAFLIEELRGKGFGRGDRLIAVGGGIVQDVACFVATVYMRGVSWDYCPTTLLGMADSCIGGKSSINVGKYKNIAGTYHAPDSILVDVDYTSTLEPDHFAGGLCEAAKICFAHSPDAFAHYLDHGPGPGMAPDALQEVVKLSLSSKKWFIEKDEFDRAERLTLNFGHTFGHALEAATDFSVNHGLAVGLGVLCALDFAARETGMRDARTEALEAHMRGLVEATLRPAALDGLDHAAFETAFRSDKKHERERFRLILPVEDGYLPLDRVPFPRDERTLASVMRSLDHVVGSVRPARVASE